MKPRIPSSTNQNASQNKEFENNSEQMIV